MYFTDFLKNMLKRFTLKNPLPWRPSFVQVAPGLWRMEEGRIGEGRVI